MNQYIMIRRLRKPVVLLLAGVIALLNEMGIVDGFWHWFIPLWLILWGVLLLAERAMMSGWGGYPPPTFPGQSYPGQPYPGQTIPGQPDYRATANIPAYPGQPEPFVPPSHQGDPDRGSEGGKL